MINYLLCQPAKRVSRQMLIHGCSECSLTEHLSRMMMSHDCSKSQMVHQISIGYLNLTLLHKLNPTKGSSHSIKTAT